MSRRESTVSVGKIRRRSPGTRRSLTYDVFVHQSATDYGGDFGGEAGSYVGVRHGSDVILSLTTGASTTLADWLDGLDEKGVRRFVKLLRLGAEKAKENLWLPRRRR